MRTIHISKILTLTLLAAGLFLSISLILFLNFPKERGLLTIPGAFLLRPFSWAAFFVPVYLLITGIFSMLNSFSSRRFVVLMSTLIPFVTLGTLLKIHSGKDYSFLELLLIQQFGDSGSIILLLTLFLAELLLILHIALTAPRRETGEPMIATLGSEKPTRLTAGQPSEKGEELPETFGLEDGSPVSEESSLSTSFREELAPLFTEETPSEEFSSLPPDSSDEWNRVSSEDNSESRTEPTEEEVVVNWESLQSLAKDFSTVKGRETASLPSSAIKETPAMAMENLKGKNLEAESCALPGEELPAELETLSFPGNLEEGYEEESESEEDDPQEDTELEEEGFFAGGGSKVSDSPREKSIPQKRRPPYIVPVKDLLNEYAGSQYWIIDNETRRAAEILRLTLEEFKISAEVTGISKGPVITMFELLPAPGVKLSKIVNLADNIALRLAASRVRIVAPIPGKHAVGIEVPNKDRAIVSFKEMLDDEGLDTQKMEIPVVLGKDITGGARVIDLVQTPHLLIAGATGSGKSVCVNSLICSILYKRNPDEVKLLLIDPKIVELKLYNDIPHLLTPVITEAKKAFRALQYAIFEMERRYSLLDALGVRDIRSFNRRAKEQKITTDHLPYIVIVVDEFADLMATTGKELESTIARLTAMSRAVGIHLVLATQRPSVDVITGLIKANIPSRIAFMVASKMDSRIIIDGMGAEKLLGRGDMLFTSAWDPHPIRIQGAFLSEGEAERVADYVKSLGEPEYIDESFFGEEEEDEDIPLIGDGEEDPLLETAVGIIVEAGKASASYLQRRLKIGYNRAARLVEEMEHRGIIGPSQGSKPREILHIPDYSKNSTNFDEQP